VENGNIEISFGELMAQVAALLAEFKSEVRPEHRLMRIVAAMRRYKALVVQANLPRGCVPASHDARLREHREACRAPESELVRLRDWLTTRNNTFLLGDQVQWRLDDLSWEEQIWRPLFGWVEHGFALLFEGFDDSGWPGPATTREIEAWEGQEQELEWSLLGRVSIFAPADGRPLLDPVEPFTIRWRDASCFLGDTASFKIMKLLIHSIRTEGRSGYRGDCRRGRRIFLRSFS